MTTPDLPPPNPEALARARFMILNMVRAMGVAVMLIGMAIVATGVIEPRDVVGGLIFAVGFFESLIIPQILIRRWRSPPNP